MKTKDELEIEFRKEFEELLEKYKAEFYVADDGKPYGLHSGTATITIMSNYSDSGERINEYCEFLL